MAVYHCADALVWVTAPSSAIVADLETALRPLLPEDALVKIRVQEVGGEAADTGMAWLQRQVHGAAYKE